MSEKPEFPLKMSESVQEALAAGKAVVALESTIITHGMPWPRNVETAIAVEDAVRSEGAEPATLAIIDGQIAVGLSEEIINWLGQQQTVMKLSRADLAFALASNKTGSTTVAATMIAAHMAGIRHFATGGIGGVHRGAETDFDISADLQELARTPVTVVCAGAKAILDVPKTLEVLETLGVPVIGYGTDEFPAFWSRQSGLTAPLRLNSPEEIVNHDNMRIRLGLDGGTLIANPVPEEDEIERATMGKWIERALSDAGKANVVGKAVTPWLLSRIMELSGGKSLETNIALILNNARLAAKIAVSAGRHRPEL